MRLPAVLPVLVAIAVALAPAASACHPGLGARAAAGFVVRDAGPTLAQLSFAPFCEGAVMVTLTDLAPLGGPPERIAATLDILLPGVACIDLSCGGSDPAAVPLRLTAPEAGLDLVGVFDYPHAQVSFAVAGAVHGLPAAFGFGAA